MLKFLVLAALLAAAAAQDYPAIRDFVQSDSTLDSVTLSWTLDVTEFIPVIYSLQNGVLTNQFFYDGSNTYTEINLPSCSEFTFVLTAIYEEGGEGEAAETYGSTLDEVPEEVVDLVLEDTVLTWTPPDNANCIDFYNVCYESTVTGYGDCTQALSPTFDLGEISGCDDVIFRVSGVAGELEGPVTEGSIETDYMSPGIPRNYEVTILSETTVELAWDAPLENPACVQEYSIVYGPADNTTETIIEVVNTKPEEEGDDEGNDDLDVNIREGPSGQEFTAILDNLLPCTEYRFGLSTLSETDEQSDIVYQNRATNGTAPGEIPDITYDKDQDSITITWGDVSEESCLSVIQICYSDPIEITTECLDLPKYPNTWTLEGLRACREYDFIIRGESADGESGPPRYISVSTSDVAPGPVREMHLGSIGVTSLTVTYMDPLYYPECVDQFVITYKNVWGDSTTKSRAATGSNYTDQINGLDACALYEVGVYAVSPSGLEGNITTQNTQLRETTPEPPITGTMLTATDHTVTLLWYAPQDTRYCVNSYTVKISQPGGGEGVQEDVDVTTFNEEVLHTFSGLAPCTGYVAEMRSWNHETDTASDFVQVVTDVWTNC